MKDARSVIRNEQSCQLPFQMCPQKGAVATAAPATSTEQAHIRKPLSRRHVREIFKREIHHVRVLTIITISHRAHSLFTNSLSRFFFFTL